MLAGTCGFFAAVKFLTEYDINAHRPDGLLISLVNLIVPHENMAGAGSPAFLNRGGMPTRPDLSRV
ncbi:hypothetical protein [Brasilonema sp. UFV-L1]|uniref:hypothetical protein n=1 Tax=Brasilonema sp. UFV-L1 TaxID=2234130 RepID=UPI00145FBF5E|nr:hypothetical protein [Brasilonema sp. UFV-L1]